MAVYIAFPEPEGKFQGHKFDSLPAAKAHYHKYLIAARDIGLPPTPAWYFQTQGAIPDVIAETIIAGLVRGSVVSKFYATPLYGDDAGIIEIDTEGDTHE